MIHRRPERAGSSRCDGSVGARPFAPAENQRVVTTGSIFTRSFAMDGFHSFGSGPVTLVGAFFWGHLRVRYAC
jgi:hypothetical protein